MSTAITPAEPAPQAPQEPTPEKRSLVQRVPTAVFVTTYGAIVVALVVLVAMLASYRADGTPARQPSTATGTAATATSAEPELPEPVQPWNPPPVDEANLRASIRPHLISNVESATTETGIVVRGEISGELETVLPELSGHLSRLLEQNCVRSLTLTTPDNLRLSFYNFCYTTVPQAAIAEFAAMADEENAEALIFTDTHSPTGIEADLNWLNVKDSDLTRLEHTWRDMTRPATIGRLRLAAYGETEGLFREAGAGTRTKMWRDPVGEAVERRK
ncbi:hypothetical protein M5J20_00960 [Corynebacterium sp. TA-R-1]|uniref:Uncharacterized protein n=1 Tax=Corynebacterium stercoris TaxID=2943490 RepID=A0ABT1G165_9CORY|nr:hypothetical protein [Corynebacterium stercoris]MCP1386773.1 hypothetical protein [Corynebacterium stercoris]